MKTYKVWISIEMHDDDAEHARDEYVDIDPGFASEGEFDELDNARAYADFLHDLADVVRSQE